MQHNKFLMFRQTEKVTCNNIVNMHIFCSIITFLLLYYWTQKVNQCNLVDSTRVAVISFSFFVTTYKLKIKDKKN